MNEQFQPAITTGAYDDTDVTDEFYWAATELYLLTRDEQYKSELENYKSKIAGFTPAVWGNVAELAMLELQDTAAILAHLQPYMDEAETVSVHRSP